MYGVTLVLSLEINRVFEYLWCNDSIHWKTITFLDDHVTERKNLF